MEDALIELFLGALPVLVIGGLAGQWLALRRFEGGWRLAAWIPVLSMGAAIAAGVFGAIAGSNLAPIWIVFALPQCLLWLAGLWLVRAIVVLVTPDG